MKNLITILLIAMWPSMYAWAEADLNQQIFNAKGSKVAAQAAGDTAVSEAPQDNTINQGSKVGQSSQGSGAAANAAAAAALMTACLAPCPKCMIPLCVMSMLAAQQAGHDKGAQGQSALSDDSSIDSKAPETPNYDQGAADYADGTLKAVKDKLKEKGVTVTGAGVTMPDGSFTPMSAFNSPSSMLAAGVDPSMVSEAKKVLGEVEAAAAKGKPKMDMSTASGGGGAPAPYPTEEVSNDVEVQAATNPFDLTGDQAKKLLANKTVMLDGEPIGVAGNNIFGMIHEAYQKKSNGNQFLDGAQVPRVRRPASTTVNN